MDKFTLSETTVVLIKKIGTHSQALAGKAYAPNREVKHSVIDVSPFRMNPKIARMFDNEYVEASNN
jgi:hypothetical protein